MSLAYLSQCSCSIIIVSYQVSMNLIRSTTVRLQGLSQWAVNFVLNELLCEKKIANDLCPIGLSGITKLCVCVHNYVCVGGWVEGCVYLHVPGNIMTVYIFLLL